MVDPEDTKEPFGSYRDALQKVLDNYIIKYNDLNFAQRFNITTGYNIQWYPIGGGFKANHTENNGIIDNSSRVLVFMTYLNDVPDGGSYFKAQDLEVKAEKGLTLIWPAGITHYHKGIVSNTSEKMIITGWYDYVDLYLYTRRNNE